MKVRSTLHQGSKGIGEGSTQVLGPEDESSGDQYQARELGPSLNWPVAAGRPKTGAEGCSIAGFSAQEPGVVGAITVMAF